MKYKLLSLISIILIIGVSAALDFFGEGASKAPYQDAQLNGPYSVIRVVDGDTFIADISGERTRVRMIGIDTAESVQDNPERITKEGLVASNYTKSLLTGAEVFLEFDKEHYDRFGRTLAYVYIKGDDGYVFINELLLNEGLADLMTIEPNTKYQELLEDAFIGE
mgnify:CR=1 FL=1